MHLRERWDLPVFLVKREIADQLLAPSGKTSDALQAQIERTLHPASFDVSQSSACLNKEYTGVETHKGRATYSPLARRL